MKRLSYISKLRRKQLKREIRRVISVCKNSHDKKTGFHEREPRIRILITKERETLKGNSFQTQNTNLFRLAHHGVFKITTDRVSCRTLKTMSVIINGENLQISHL